jgi:uncharacterized protein
MDTPESIVALAKRFIAAIMAKDVDTIRQVYAPDARIWHNFDGIYQTVDDNIKGVFWIHKVLAGVNYDVKHITPFAGGWVQEHVLRGTLASGEAFAMPACVICKVKDGRVISLDEYLDFAHTKPLRDAGVKR